MHFSCGIVRPPYEAGSCFLQVTSGCSHNKCRFCTFYKEAPFSVSPESEIREDLQEIRDSGWKVKRIFLQGADPFLLSYDRLKRIMDLIKEYLPWGVSVGGYGRVDSVRNKSVGELKSLKEMGYDMIVFGIESGDDAVLDKMNKGYHAMKVAYDIFKESVDRMVDESCGVEEEKAFRQIIMKQSGVLSIDDLKTRLFGSKIYVDLEIAVDGNLSVFQGHRIAENVHSAIERTFPAVKHITVHVNPVKTGI